MRYQIGDCFEYLGDLPYMPLDYDLKGQKFVVEDITVDTLTTYNLTMYNKTYDLLICCSELELHKHFKRVFDEPAPVKPQAIVLSKEKKEMDKQYESDDKMVSHPDHYQSSNGVECIEAIKAATENLTGIFATDTGNIIKYAWRWNDKGTPIQDVKKIIWYATHLLNELEAVQNNNMEY